MRPFLNVEIINIRECWMWSECWMKFQSMCKRFVSSCGVCDLAADRFSFSSVWCGRIADMFNFVWNRCDCHWKRWHSHREKCKSSWKRFVACASKQRKGLIFLQLGAEWKNVSFYMREKRSMEIFMYYVQPAKNCLKRIFRKDWLLHFFTVCCSLIKYLQLLI